MISQTAEYALRAVVCLAGHQEAPMPTQQIAAITGVPGDYLSKVLQSLSRHGIVASTGGRKGGFLLKQPPDTITIFDVVQAVDELHRIEHCPLNPKLQRSDLCPLHRELDKAMATVAEAFTRCKISDLVTSEHHHNLCTPAVSGPRRKGRPPKQKAST